ncbi:MAG: metallophosphoesterase [candidate division Zixibacteria bacterium]|nr:metallophosphoesterase [candidate division Zixibacteria bacterium]
MLFFLIVIIVFALMYGYIGWRIIVPAAFSLPVNIILWGLLVIFLILPFFTHIARYFGFEGGWVDVLAWIGYLSFGFLTLLFALLVTRDLILIITLGAQKIYHIISNLGSSTSTIAETADPVRRRFIMNSLNAALVIAAGGLTGYGLFEALRRPRIVEVNLPIEGLPKDLDGFTIAQITDIHVSHTLRRPFVQTVVDMVNDLQPDLVALTGDLVDGNVAELGDDVAPLADLKAPYGAYFITGNHEYYSGVEQWLKEIPRLGFKVLINEHRLIERGEGRLLLAGVTDFTGGSFRADHISDPHRALAGAPESHAKILLAHQPKSIFEAAKAGFDYVISGHTHGGQYFPYHFLAALAQPYISGLHEHGNTRIYVSNGTGYWGPQLRIGARSEITLHRLVST